MADTGISISPETFMNFGTTIFWIGLGVIGAAIVLIVLWKLWDKKSYNIHITVYKRAGNIAIKEEDWAKKFVDAGGNYRFHYWKLNRRSPIIHDKYKNFIRKKWFFFFQKSYPNFDVFHTNGALYPMETKYNYFKKGMKIELQGINYDTYNFIQQEVKTLQIKHQRIDRLLGILPYLGLLLVVLAFIIGTAINNQHMEKMSQLWLSSAQQAAQNIIDKVANVQVIPQQ